ncbi:hypothetical protein COH94_08955 [Neisseria meningitidis]|nr:hypothetical protein COH94_08955 [Neisseria meningitidis]
MQSFLLPVFLCLMPSEAVSARPLCEYLLHLAIRPFFLTLMLTYTPVPYTHHPPLRAHEPVPYTHHRTHETNNQRDRNSYSTTRSAPPSTTRTYCYTHKKV